MGQIFFGVAAGLLVLLPVTIVFAPVWPLAALDRTTVAHFAAANRLHLDAVSGRYVVEYLVRNLRWRRWGGLIGLVAAVLAMVMNGHSTTSTVSAGTGLTTSSTGTHYSPTWLFLIGVGYFLGALVAEWRSGSTVGGTRRAALLEPRTRSDYLEPSLLRTAYGTLVAAAAILTATSIWPHYAANVGSVERTGILALLGLVVLVIEVTTRWIVGRPQPLDTGAMLASREAVRASCVNLLAGIGVSFAWFLLSWEAISSMPTGASPLAPVLMTVALLSLFASVRSWFRVRRRAWTNGRRPERAPS